MTGATSMAIAIVLAMASLLFVIHATWLGHGITEWQTFTDDAREHGEEPEVGDFIAEFGQSTLENWQSEFLQLLWQVSGLALLWHVGSPQSKSESDRAEEKLDLILRKLDKENADKEIKQLDKEYPKK